MIFLLSFGLQESHKLSHKQCSLPSQSAVAKGELAFSSEIETIPSDDKCQLCDAIKKINKAQFNSAEATQLTSQSIDIQLTYTNNYSFAICQTQRNKAPPVC